MARVRPWVGRTDPTDSGIQSIWFLKTAVFFFFGAAKVLSAPGFAPKRVWSRNERIGTYKVAVLLGRHPDVTVAPFAEVAELLHLAVVVLLVVFDGQTVGIEDAHVAAQAEEDSTGFEGEEARE